MFVLKYLTKLRIIYTMETLSTSRGWRWLYYYKNNMMPARCQKMKMYT